MKIKLDKSWTKLSKNSEKPKEDSVVLVIDTGGYETKLGYKNNQWWYSDFSTIVYWKPIAFKYEA